MTLGPHRGNVHGVRTCDVAELLGVSYRRVDYLTRTGAVDGMNLGSGSRREWDTATVIRLVLANHVVAAVPVPGDATPFPDVARAALANHHEPPRRGYAIMASDPLAISWVATWADVRPLVEHSGAVVLVAYDLDALVGDVLDLTAVPR